MENAVQVFGEMFCKVCTRHTSRCQNCEWPVPMLPIVICCALCLRMSP